MILIVVFLGILIDPDAFLQKFFLSAACGIRITRFFGREYLCIQWLYHQNRQICLQQTYSRSF